MEVEILCQCGSNLGGEKLWENYGRDEDVGGLVGIVEQLLTVPAIFCKTSKYRKNCECCPVSQLSVRYQRLSCIQAPNCQNCNQCLKCHKSAGLSCVAIVTAHCRTQFKMWHRLQEKILLPVARKNPATYRESKVAQQLVIR